ncbi:MAG: hypothetical protein H9Q67_07305 [Spiroplasma ixodetis]|nr:hypothetical protein [Spiroplasma ixodetis]
MEDKIFGKSTDPFPKEIEKTNNETIFLKIYKDFDATTFKSLPGSKYLHINKN